jgi:NAD(P)-dependent dehydrogenase (short-subunit alcohol dehydrogenase family)
VDVSSRTQVEQMVSDVVRDMGSIDVLVNNAAVIVREPILEYTDEMFDRQMNINFRGTALCSQAALRVMKEQGRGGNIVNVSSMGIIAPPPGIALYVASKAAIAGFSRVLALEAARYKVNVSIVAPGVMNTAMGRDSGPTVEEADRMSRGQLLKRPLEPDEVADAVIYAATTSSPALTGQILWASGGSYFG